MLQEACVGCNQRKPSKSSDKCQRCLARERYIAANGEASPFIMLICDGCGLEFADYKSNQQWEHSFCSKKCRVEWVAVHNSISRGGDGGLKTKPERDALYYRSGNHANVIRLRANKHYADNKDETLRKRREQDRAVKQAVVDAYGGKCECCGESMIEFLTIDHINNDGALHRRKVGKGRRIYKDLIALGFPKDNYRLLCFNCNITRGFYGYCPHKPEEKSITSHVPLGVAGRKRSVA